VTGDSGCGETENKSSRKGRREVWGGKKGVEEKKKKKNLESASSKETDRKLGEVLLLLRSQEPTGASLTGKGVSVGKKEKPTNSGGWELGTGQAATGDGKVKYAQKN